PPITVRGMINLDIIGSENGPDGTTDDHSIRLFSAEPNDSPSRQLARQIALFISTYRNDVKVMLQSAEERAGRWGDHQSFSAAGYPALHIIQGVEDPLKERTIQDTIDNVQPDYLLRTTLAALSPTALLADGPLAPADLAHRVSPEEDSLVWTPVKNASGYIIALRTANSLTYDQVLVVNTSAHLDWNGISKYGAVAVGSIDLAGRIGP